MAIHGKRDDEGERRRLEKARENGFGQPGKAGRPKKDSTEIIEQKAAERMEGLVDRAIDAIERGLKSGNEKTALSAADKFFKTFYHPTQNVNITGSVEKTEYHMHILQGQNELSEADQNLLGEFLDVLRKASDDIIEAELVEVENEDPAPSSLKELEEGTS